MEAISVIGYDPKDVSVTTVKGALCVTSCVEVRINSHFSRLKVQTLPLEFGMRIKQVKSSPGLC